MTKKHLLHLLNRLKQPYKNYPSSAHALEGFRLYKNEEIMQSISKNNPLILKYSKLKDKKYRDIEGLFAFDGIKLTIEAIKSNVDILNIFITQELLAQNVEILKKFNDRIFIVSQDIIGKLSPDKTPDGVVCVAKHLDNISYKETVISGSALIAYNIQDPGNLGTIIRSSRAFGIDNLIVSSNCADIYNRRVIRASMGAAFRQNITVWNKDIDIDFYRDLGYKIIATALRNRCIPLNKLNINDKTVFVVGNEGHGLPDEFIEKCDECTIIPMLGDTESLNASTAASILMWEISKRN